MTKSAPAASQHRPGERPSSWTTAVTRPVAVAAVLAGAHVVRRQEDADGEPHEVGRQPEPDHRPTAVPPHGEVHQPDDARRRHGEGEQAEAVATAAPGAGEPEPHQDREHQVEGDLGGQAPHLRQTVGQVVVDVDVGQQQRGDPLADPGPAVARQQCHGGDDRHDVDGDQAQGTLPQVVRRRRRRQPGPVPRDPGPGQQEAGQHEEHRDTDVEPRQRRPVDRVCVGPGPEGGVRGEDGDGRHRPEGIECGEGDRGSRTVSVEHGGECPTRQRAQHYSSRMLLLRRVRAVLSRVVSEARERGDRRGRRLLRPVGRSGGSRGVRARGREHGSFAWDGARLPYFVHDYHYTWLNERAVEVALALDLLERHPGASVLEVGNVLGHYVPFEHTVVDKYEQAAGRAQRGRRRPRPGPAVRPRAGDLDAGARGPRRGRARRRQAAAGTRAAARARRSGRTALGDAPGRLQPGARRAAARRCARRRADACPAPRTGRATSGARSRWSRPGGRRTTVCSTRPTPSSWPSSTRRKAVLPSLVPTR